MKLGLMVMVAVLLGIVITKQASFAQSYSAQTMVSTYDETMAPCVEESRSFQLKTCGNSFMKRYRAGVQLFWHCVGLPVISGVHQSGGLATLEAACEHCQAE